MRNSYGGVIGVFAAIAMATAGVGVATGGPAAGGTLAAGAPTPMAKVPASPGDFNGDGWRDVAIGSPFGMVGDIKAGFVTVVPGGPSGPVPAKRQVVSQSSSGIPGGSEEYDRFGAALASADFDRDGYADLAVAATGEDGPILGGRATLIYGGSMGLSSRAVALNVAAGSLAVGDFDRDGNPDLAVGSYGRFWVYSRLAAGDTTGVATEVGRINSENAETHVTAADFTGDGYADLVYWLRFAPIGGGDDFLRLNLHAGSSAGLATTPAFSDDQTTADALAAGDVNGDGRADLVLGDSYGGGGSGVVKVYPGTASGLGAPRPITQDTTGVPETNEPADSFGGSVAVGDVNGDGKADVAVGNPGENIANRPAAGAVTILYGAAGGLTGQGAKLFHQDSAEVPGSAEQDDVFGAAVSLADVIAGRQADLAVGSPNENGGEGVVYLLQGASTGLTSTGTKAFYSTTLGVSGRDAAIGQVLLP